MGKVTAGLMLAGVAFIALTCFGTRASYAFGDAPWCAVISLGPGDVYWDCEYRSLDECTPNVVAGNRGFCSLNPAPGSSARGAPHRHRRWHHWRHRR